MTNGTQTTNTGAAQKREVGPVTRLALDFGPLIVYFLAYRFTNKNVFAATGIFMGATVLAMLYSLVRTGRVSLMQFFSAVMVLGLGGLTIWLHDADFIKMKPTIYYLMVTGILFFGLWTRKPTLKLVLGQSFPGLSEQGWTLLSRNWAFFFLAMAGANELVWRTMSTDFWLGYKIWGAIPATVIFTIANLPMLNKHGLHSEEAEGQPALPPQG